MFNYYEEHLYHKRNIDLCSSVYLNANRFASYATCFFSGCHFHLIPDVLLLMLIYIVFS